MPNLPIGAFVDSLDLDQLSEIIVTDTKVAQSQEAVTQKVQVLYSEDFDQYTVYNRNIAELLRYNAGQFVNVLSRNDANWGSFGGLGPNYNAYLLDGIPIDSFADAMSLDSWAFDRIEIHEGPASVLYPNYLTMDFAGNESPMAGTTNFILKDQIDAPLTRFQLSGGSFNTLGGSFYRQDRSGNFNYFAGGSFERSDYTNYGTTPSWLNILEDPTYKKGKLYARMTYFLGSDDEKVSLFMHHTSHTGDAGRPNRDFHHLYDTLNLTYSKPIGEAWNLQTKAGFRSYDRNWGEDNYPASLSLREYERVEQKILPAELTLTFKHAGRSILSVGADTQLATYRTFSEVSGVRSQGNDVKARSAGLFIQEKLVLDRWVFRVGTRIERTGHSYDGIGGSHPGVDSKSWDNRLWSAGARFNAVQGLSLYANVGTSFVAPSAKSVGGTLLDADAGAPGKDGQLPNKDLRPERGLGLDAGMDLRPTESLSLGFRVFFNRLDDAIVENVVSTSPSQSRSVNAGRARSDGFELTVEQAMSESIYWFGNFTQTRTQIQNAYDPDQDGAQTPFVPDYVANAGLTLALPLGLTVSSYLHASGVYYDSSSKRGRRPFGQRQLLNVKAQASFSRNQRYALGCSLELNNLANKKSELPWQFRDPGFNVLVGLQLSF